MIPVYGHVVENKYPLPRGIPGAIEWYEHHMHIPLRDRIDWPWGNEWLPGQRDGLLGFVRTWVNSWGHVPANYSGIFQLDIENIEMESDNAAYNLVPLIYVLKELRPGMKVGIFNARLDGGYVIHPDIAAACDIGYVQLYPTRVVTRDPGPLMGWEIRVDEYRKMLDDECAAMAKTWIGKPMVMVGSFRRFHLGGSSCSWIEFSEQWKAAQRWGEIFMPWDAPVLPREIDECGQFWSRIVQQIELGGFPQTRRRPLVRF
jgi:hypothetical protein